MAIDVKNIQVRAQRVVDFSVAYVKKHPILTSALSFLFLLYVFLRSLFFFLLFSIPIFIFLGFSFRLIFRVHQENLRTAKGETYNHARKLTPSRGGRNLDKRVNSYGNAQSVRRRSSKKYDNHVHFQEDPYEKDTLFSNLDKDNNDLVDKTSMVEETPKEIREVEIDDGSGLRPIRYSDERLAQESESSDEREEEEDEPEDRNKAVEWTEDDQKNLMDLGFSEMERNKRLESLIAKRKARKLLSLQVRRTLMNIGKGEPFVIPKIGNLPRSKSAEALISPTPGSAPSVLLPVHNPFDIPYDPQEEKPNLTGGFQEGLVENHYNDAVFCRHESFSLGSFSQGPWDRDQTLAESSNRSNLCRLKSREIPEFSRFKEQIDKDYPCELKETVTSQECEIIPCVNGSNDPIQQCQASELALDSNDVHSGNDAIKVENDSKLDTDDIHESISSSSSDVITSYSTDNKNEMLNPLSFSIRKNIPVPELDTNFRRDEFFYHDNPSPYDYKGMYAHTPSMSIASDMQVEVSEAGSQITTLSSDGGSPKYDSSDDVNVEKEGSSKKKQVWVASPPMKRVEANEARSGEVREVSEQDIMEVGLSRINQDTKESITLQNSENHSNSYVDKVHDKVENSLQIPKEPFNSVEKISSGEKTVDVMNDQVELVYDDDQGILKFIQHTYGEDTILKSQETLQDISTSVLNDDTKPVDISKNNYTQPEKNDSTYVESLVGKQSEPENVTEGLNIMGSNDTQVREILAEKVLTNTSTPEDKVTSVTGVNDSEITASSKKDQSEQVETAKTLTRPIKRVSLRDIKAKLKSEGTDEQPTSSPSSTRKKFYLMANMKFDDIYEECQQFDVDFEANGNMPEDLEVNQTQVGDSVVLQESSCSLSPSTGDRAVNEDFRSIVEKTSDNVADTGSKASTEETTKTETIEVVEKIGETEKSEDVVSDTKVDNTTDNSETVEVVENISENLTALDANKDSETVVVPILNDDMKPLDVTQDNCTVPESNNSNYVESSKGDVERQHEKNVTETLDVTGDSNRIVREAVDENSPTKASSVASSTSATVDKNPSMFLEKPTPISVIPKAVIEQVNVVSSPSSTRKKFYLMANLKFDDIYEDENSPEDSTAEQTNAGDSVGLKDSNEGMGGGLVQADEKRADVSSQTLMEETETAITSVGVTESNPANLVASDANKDPDIRVAPDKIE